MKFVISSFISISNSSKRRPKPKSRKYRSVNRRCSCHTGPSVKKIPSNRNKIYLIGNLCCHEFVNYLECWSQNDAISLTAAPASHQDRCYLELLELNRANLRRLLEHRRNTCPVHQYRSICTANRCWDANACSLGATWMDNCPEMVCVVVRVGSYPASRTCIYKFGTKLGRHKPMLKLWMPFPPMLERLSISNHYRVRCIKWCFRVEFSWRTECAANELLVFISTTYFSKIRLAKWFVFCRQILNSWYHSDRIWMESTLNIGVSFIVLPNHWNSLGLRQWF